MLLTGGGAKSSPVDGGSAGSFENRGESRAGAVHADVALDQNAILSVEDVGFMQATRFPKENTKSGSCLPWSSAAANAARVSAVFLEAMMNLESGRSAGSTGVFPFIDLGEQIWDALCSSSFGTADRGAGSFRLRSLFFCQTFLLTCRARILEGHGTTAQTGH